MAGREPHAPARRIEMRGSALIPRQTERRSVARVLVVQQDADARTLYASWLEGAGFEVVTCEGPGAAGVCPTLQGEPCPLCQESDLLFYSQKASEGVGIDARGGLFKALRERYPSKPLLLGDVENDAPDWLGTLPGVNATVAHADEASTVRLARDLVRQARKSWRESGRAVKMLEIRDLSKQFAGTWALAGASIDVYENEVIGLVGENGAGKSTLLNILSGVMSADSGEVLLHGKVVAPRSYHEATLQGVFRVYQEQALVPNIPVYENLFLSHEERFQRFGVISRRKMARSAREMLAVVGKHIGVDFDPRRLTGDYRFSERQVIEIVKACSLADLLGVKTPLILLDEPTTALSGEEILFFISLVRQLRDRAAFIFVSHRLSEVLNLSDRVYVLKDGKIVSDLDSIDTTESRLHELMVGRKRDEQYYKENEQSGRFGEQVLGVDGLSKGLLFSDVSLTVRAGEIVGIGGVLGSGKSEVGRVIMGAMAPDAGEISLSGKVINELGIADRINAGIGYVPQERHHEGLMLYQSVARNIMLPSVISMKRFGLPLLDMAAEKDLSNQAVKAFGIRTPSIRALGFSLSGGNQQKVVLARWLARRAKMLVLDNPTRGVDAGAKEEIYSLLRQFCREGVAILLITDDILELIGLSDRVLIMKDGQITSEVVSLPTQKPSEKQLVAYMV
jgi:ribose transport system ATP-binding protein